jgi:hypothetical protein
VDAWFDALSINFRVDDDAESFVTRRAPSMYERGLSVPGKEEALS